MIHVEDTEIVRNTKFPIVKASNDFSSQGAVESDHRGFGLSPEEAARLLTSSEPHRTYLSKKI